MHPKRAVLRVRAISREHSYLKMSDAEQSKIVKVCSYCHNVANDNHDDAAPVAWITPEEYYQRGGTSEVRLSHGICPPCYERLELAIECG